MPLALSPSPRSLARLWFLDHQPVMQLWRGFTDYLVVKSIIHNLQAMLCDVIPYRELPNLPVVHQMMLCLRGDGVGQSLLQDKR